MATTLWLPFFMSKCPYAAIAGVRALVCKKTESVIYRLCCILWAYFLCLLNLVFNEVYLLEYNLGFAFELLHFLAHYIDKALAFFVRCA